MHRHAIGLVRFRGLVRLHGGANLGVRVHPSRVVRVKAPESIAAERPVVADEVGPSLTLSSVRRRTFRAFNARAFWPCFAGAFVLTLVVTVACFGALHGQDSVSNFFWMIPLVAGPFAGLGLLYQRGWFKALVTVTDNGLLLRTPLAAPVQVPLPASRIWLRVAESDSSEGARRVALDFVSNRGRICLGFQTPHDADIAGLRRRLEVRPVPRVRIPVEMAPSELAELVRRVVP